MRIAFMGTPDFSIPTLKALIEAGHEIAAVYSQPPRPAGRGKKDRLTPVHEFALKNNLPIFTPLSLKSAEEQQKFKDLNLDAAVVVAYGLILPKAILEAPRLGCLNVHASLLPRWRGAAPIQRAIMAGDTETGIGIMQMDEGLDTGAILAEEVTPISKDETARTLHDRLCIMGARNIVPALIGLHHGSLPPHPQPEDGITYAKKLTKQEAQIDWSRTASEVRCHIHGLNPFPGAWTQSHGERLKILEVEESDMSGAAGEMIAAPFVIACGTGALRILKLQKAGKRPMLTDDLLRGMPIEIGTKFS
jgi:methionyl-tRNA formyltransferase